jgi:hypothetical protein
MIWLIILLAISVVLNGVLAFLLIRATKRLLQYDEVFQYMAGDIQTNLGQFYRMSKSSVTGGEPEIVQAHKNMMVMAQRLNEILNQMEEVTGKRFRPESLGPPPQVV